MLDIRNLLQVRAQAVGISHPPLDFILSHFWKYVYKKSINNY
nr:MAG TPA: hypothetical protein [Caudoviricetes sp.]